MKNLFAKTVSTIATVAICSVSALAQGYATVQIMHTAADTNIQGVDVWLGNTKILSNFGYLRSTPTLSLPAGVEHQVRIKRPGSIDTSGPLLFKRYTLDSNTHNVILGMGKLGNNVPAQPDGIPCQFDLGVLAWGRSSTLEPNTTGFRLFNAVVDASSLTLNIANGGGILLGPAQYSTFSNYTVLPSIYFNVDCMDTRGFMIKRYDIGAYGNNDSLITIVATGFQDTAWAPIRPFQLWGLMRSGRTFPLVPQTVAAVRNFAHMGVSLYPNPAENGLATIVSDRADGSLYDVTVLDNLGRNVYQIRSVLNGGGAKLNMQGMPKGLYTVQVTDAKQQTAQCRLEL